MKSLVFRLILMIFGVLGIWIFLLPFFNRRILNIGNLTGILVFLSFLLYGIFFTKVNQFCALILKNGGLSKWLLIAFFSLIFLIAILGFSLSFKVYQGFSKKPTRNATAVVLGCKVYGKRPSLMLRERLDAAYSYLLKNPGATCILSGGQGEGEDISEAEAMFLYLKEKGIDEKRLFLEDKSTNTRENLRFSKDILEEKGLGSDIAIVTNEFHEFRARKIASDLELNSGAVPGRTAWWLLPTFFVRELYSILYEWVR